MNRHSAPTPSPYPGSAGCAHAAGLNAILVVAIAALALGDPVLPVGLVGVLVVAEGRLGAVDALGRVDGGVCGRVGMVGELVEDGGHGCWL